MWSHADVIAQKIKIGIEGTQFTFRDAKVPRTRPSRRLQSLTGETPAAANDSSQQAAKDHFRITVYYTSIVSELQSRFEGNDQEVLCALGEIAFSRSPSINNIQTVSNFYGVDSEMLSSEKSIFENYDCGDPCQRKNTAVMLKTMHQNGLHDILPVLYKVASILATIPASSCSAEGSFSVLRRIKTFLRSTMGQDRLSNIAVINIEREYPNKNVEGIIIRSRARWYEHGERSSKYFLNLEKRNHVKKHIRKLDINGVLTTDPLKILNEQKRFYQELYQSINKMSNNSEIISLFLDNLNIPKLSETDKNYCEGKISVSECHKLLDSFQNNKTPGNDGMPIEFYKKFWSLISDPFINSINECFEKGEMSVSQKQAVITLIEKKGKDRSSLENWWPISLLNVDTKIMTKVLAARIKEVLPSIIHHNQTGYIKDRFIGETKKKKKKEYPNKTMQNDMQRVIDIFGRRSNRSSYFF